MSTYRSLSSVADLFTPDEFLTLQEFTKKTLGDREPGPRTLREVSKATLAHMLRSNVFFIKNFCYTVQKDTQEVLIDPFIGQYLVLFAREVQRRLGFAQRIIEIKPRQVGWTTINLADGFHKMFHPNAKVQVLVMDDDVADDLMLKVNTFYNALPSALVPMKRIDNSKMLVFDNPDPRSRSRNRGLNSSFNITTPSQMRGKTPTFLVISEFAHMKNPDEIMEGLVQAMPLSPASSVTIDTTPNGFDDRYYPMVCQAVEDNPQWVAAWERKGAPSVADIFSGALGMPDNPGKWVPVFMPWFWHEEYCTQEDHPRGHLPPMTEREAQHLKATLGKEERYGGEEETELWKRYGVSLGRLWWRRNKLDTSTGSPDINERLLMFRQEFAATWHSCFVEYNFSPFDRQGLDIVSRGLERPKVRGRLATDEKGAIYVDPSYRSEWEEVRIYRAPEPGRRYTIGVDTAAAYESEEADWTVAQVIERERDEQVAVYAAKVPPHRLRDQLYLLYRWYNNGYLAIETENVGYALPRQLFDMGARNQYYWKRMDSDVPKQTDYLGWETSWKTRPDMESILVELVGKRAPGGGGPDPGIVLHDQLTIQQMQSVKRYPDGRIKAQGKAHDDYVVALMIALIASRDPYAPWRYREPEREEAPQLSRLGARYQQLFRTPGTRNRPHFDNL